MKFQADYFDNNVIYEMGMMLCFVFPYCRTQTILSLTWQCAHSQH